MTCDQMSQLFEQRLRQASSLLSCGGDGGEAQDGCDQDSVAEAWPVADIAPDFDKPRWLVVPERGSSRRVSRARGPHHDAARRDRDTSLCGGRYQRRA